MVSTALNVLLLLLSTSTVAMALRHSHRLFVYGTLKRGFYNHNVYLRLAEKSGAAIFLGTARTVDTYTLGIMGPRCIPALWENPSKTGQQIEGEMFGISDRCLAAMDILEGVATGRYYRVKRSIRLVSAKEEEEQPIMDCWVYLQKPPNDDDELDSSCHESYTKDLHDLYVPPSTEPDPTILELLNESDEK
ncbi:Putative gamma-glutamylcyclotransferase [Seminavis robusta]|uniref:Gamma-glutamylcyclotransferase family protein n=1 Tax=Seminavis robusta TaxID=568900 RepID=A0A9N8HK59_9STRA|nr:Putative gamma-glutamylcyclotransferase [Seminavis robusta]|eukprot:Sro708_g190790.1 Putative gamma-glutamylcyclotransferase (191) ;mRNA; r:49831-50403